MTRAQSPKPLARAIFPALSSVIDDAPGIRVKKQGVGLQQFDRFQPATSTRGTATGDYAFQKIPRKLKAPLDAQLRLYIVIDATIDSAQ